MKKAWTDLKSFITVVTYMLFAYCVIARIPVDETLKILISATAGFFLGSKIPKDKEE